MSWENMTCELAYFSSKRRLQHDFHRQKSTCKTTIAKKNPLKLLPVATRQTFPCKYTLFTASNASLWLYSSVNHETFLEIYLAKINNILPASKRLLTKIPLKNVFGNFQAHV